MAFKAMRILRWQLCLPTSKVPSLTQATVISCLEMVRAALHSMGPEECLRGKRYSVNTEWINEWEAGFRRKKHQVGRGRWALGGPVLKLCKVVMKRKQQRRQTGRCQGDVKKTKRRCDHERQEKSGMWRRKWLILSNWVLLWWELQSIHWFGQYGGDWWQ